MLWIIRTGLAGVAGLALALPSASAFASVFQQVASSENRVWSPVSEPGPFSGEIEYAFDTALNKTTVRFATSLASGNVLFRVLSGPPAVHTLVAVYEFRGRSSITHPESVRVSLTSNEFRQAWPESLPSLGVEPVLVVSIGDSVVRYPLAIAQRVDELEVVNMPSPVYQPSRGDDPTRYFPHFSHGLQIERTSTALIPICDFLALVYARNVHGTVAGLDFDLNDAVISGLRQFAAKMNPHSVAQDGINCR